MVNILRLWYYDFRNYSTKTKTDSAKIGCTVNLIIFTLCLSVFPLLTEKLFKKIKK